MGCPQKGFGVSGTSLSAPFCPPYRFVPSFLRLGSWNVVMFISYEQLQRAAVLAWPAPS